jgi:hypothetical protein
VIHGPGLRAVHVAHEADADTCAEEIVRNLVDAPIDQLNDLPDLLRAVVALRKLDIRLIYTTLVHQVL